MNHCHKDIIAVLDEHTEGHLANLKGQMLDGQQMDAHLTMCQNLLAVCFLYADAHCTSTVHKYSYNLHQLGSNIRTVNYLN